MKNVECILKVVMLPEQRRQEIIKLNKEHGGISVNKLAAHFKVSNMTILRDIKILEKEKKVGVVRGGIITIASNLSNYYGLVNLYNDKRKHNLVEKHEIASYCAKQFVKEGSVIVIEGGSTAGSLINFLTEVPKIKVFTNGLVVANEAVEKLHANSTIICAGGVLNKQYLLFLGKDVDDFLVKQYTDVAFFSCVAFDLRIGPMDSNSQDASAKRAMLKNADRRVLMIDKTKFHGKSLEKIIDVNEITDIVTNKSADESIIAKLKEYGPELHLV